MSPLSIKLWLMPPWLLLWSNRSVKDKSANLVRLRTNTMWAPTPISKAQCGRSTPKISTLREDIPHGLAPHIRGDPKYKQQYPHLTCRHHVSAHATVVGRASCDTKSATAPGQGVPTVSRLGASVAASRCVYNGATAWHRVADLPVLHCRYRQRQMLGGRFDVAGRGTCRKIHTARLNHQVLIDSHVMQAFRASWTLGWSRTRKRLQHRIHSWTHKETWSLICTWIWKQTSRYLRNHIHPLTYIHMMMLLPGHPHLLTATMQPAFYHIVLTSVRFSKNVSSKAPFDQVVW
jgi:hypothetical protein